MKDIIRNDILEKRENHPVNERNEKSMSIMKHLLETDEFNQSLTILFYVSIKSEVETKELIKTCLSLGKKVAVPITDKEKRNLTIAEIKSLDELEPSSFGIPEPKGDFLRILNPEEIDLVIVPGIAFDHKGNRVGYGHGYYDNFLKTVREGCHRFGIAYELQIVEDIHTNENDVKVEKVITENRIISCLPSHEYRTEVV